MNIKVLLAPVALVALVGCVSTSKPMRNAQGDIMECRTNGWGWLGAPMALIQQGDCVRDLRKQGYYAVGEAPGDVKIPNSAILYKSAVGFSPPAGWAAQAITPDLKNKAVRFYAINQTIDAGVMVSTIKRSAVSDFKTYVESTRRNAISQGAGAVPTEVEFSQEGGKQVARYGVQSSVQSLRLRYGYTVIEGQTEIAIVTAWTSDANYEAVEQTLQDLTGRLSGI